MQAVEHRESQGSKVVCLRNYIDFLPETREDDEMNLETLYKYGAGRGLPDL